MKKEVDIVLRVRALISLHEGYNDESDPHGTIRYDLRLEISTLQWVLGYDVDEM